VSRATLRARVAVLATAIALCGCGSTAAGTAPTRPNVVLIVLDDLGYGDLPSYGAKDVRAPNLERVAAEGVRLVDNYSSAPICSPTRAALMTGRYQARCGIEGNLVSIRKTGDEGLPVSETSVARMLKSNGYATGCFGKWHLGFKPQFGPIAHGFDEFFGVLDVADYWQHETKSGVPVLVDGTTPVDVPGYLTDLLTDRAVAFVDRHADEPFFLEVPYTAVHEPYQRPDDPADVRDRADWSAGTRADFVAVLERADAGVGRILDALAAHGLDRRTLVIVTSDNGATGEGSSGPLSGGKHLLEEGGIRVPALLRWPGVLPAGAVSTEVAITMDLTATILAATGTAPSRPLDGVDLLSALEGRTAAARRPLFWRTDCGREGPERAERDGPWKYLRVGATERLFDVATDPGEQRDMSAERPDLVATMRADVARWEAEMDATPKEMHVGCGSP
jgi:arylsulfatase A-like enzyme